METIGWIVLGLTVLLWARLAWQVRAMLGR